jgi:hypothetical protein
MPLHLERRTGRITPAARVVKRWSEDFESGALPSWLIMDNSSGSAGSSIVWSNASTGVGGATLTTAAAASARAGLFGPQIKLDECVALRVRVIATGGRAAGLRNVSMGLGTSSNYGADVAHLAAANSVLRFGAYNGSSTTRDTYYEWLTGQRHDISVWITPADQTVYLGTGENQIVNHWVAGSAMGIAGAIRPFVRVSSANAAAQTLLVHQMSVDAYYL